jgi:hypothetical protein
VPGAIARMTEDELMCAFKAAYPQQRVMRKKLRALHGAARISIGISSGAASVALEVSSVH